MSQRVRLHYILNIHILLSLWVWKIFHVGSANGYEFGKDWWRRWMYNPIRNWNLILPFDLFCRVFFFLFFPCVYKWIPWREAHNSSETTALIFCNWTFFHHCFPFWEGLDWALHFLRYIANVFASSLCFLFFIWS